MKRELLSNDVLGIFYRHAEDGQLYAHVFGDDVRLDELEGVAKFCIVRAHPRSGVQMFALGNKEVVLRAKDGLNLSEEF